MRWLKFNLVGAGGFAVQTGALYLLTHSALHLHYLLATVIAVELAVLNNFAWHQRWTWSDRPCLTAVGTWRRLGKFNLTNGLVSILGNMILMTAFVGWFGLPVGRSNLLSVAACSLCNFILADRIVFERPAHSPSCEIV